MTNTKPEGHKRRDAETLQTDPGYRLILELDFSEMIPFVFSNIRKRGVIPVLYITINATTLLFILFYAVWCFKGGELHTGKIIWQIVAGVIAGSVLVIPPHELLHGAAYRMLGARKIRFGADLQQFIFYVTADRFPISRRELTFLALTPFVIINMVIIAATAGWGTQVTLFSASLLLSHNIMCIGDFAMINYAYNNKGEIVTFDDIKKKKSYFFSRIE